MPATPESLRPTLGQKALGVFVAIQFAAVLISNVIGYTNPIPDSTTGSAPPSPSNARDYLRFAADRFCEATGQPQGWGMFEAGYMYNSVAWDVRIEWDDGRVERIQGVARLPDDLNAYNLPARLNRRFVYESSLLGIDLLLVESGIDRSAFFVEDVRVNNAAYLAFFRSVYKRECGNHHNWPTAPKWMELTILRSPTPNPQEGSDTATQVRYVARWQPAKANAHELPVEAYDRTMPVEPYRRFPKP